MYARELSPNMKCRILEMRIANFRIQNAECRSKTVENRNKRMDFGLDYSAVDTVKI